MLGMKQWMRAASRRVIRRSDVAIVRCRNPHARPPRLVGLTVVRSNRLLGIDQSLVGASMCKAGETDADMQARFRRGDEFFALRGSAGVVTSTWVTYADRAEGAACIRAAPERAILYHSMTLPEYRGDGLSSMLMQQLQSMLLAEGRIDFVACVNHLDTCTLQAFSKSNFTCVAVVRELVLLNRIKVALPQRVHDPGANALFAASVAVDNVAAPTARKEYAS